MELMIDYEKLENLTEIETINPVEIFYIAKTMLSYLTTHNKNYTKAQYHLLEKLNGIMDSISIKIN